MKKILIFCERYVDFRDCNDGDEGTPKVDFYISNLDNFHKVSDIYERLDEKGEIFFDGNTVCEIDDISNVQVKYEKLVSQESVDNTKKEKIPSKLNIEEEAVLLQSLTWHIESR